MYLNEYKFHIIIVEIKVKYSNQVLNFSKSNKKMNEKALKYLMLLWRKIIFYKVKFKDLLQKARK